MRETRIVPFPIPMEMINEWPNIIRNNNFYYIEGFNPGNVICVNKHDMITKILEIKEVINKDKDPNKYQSIIIDSLGGVLENGNGKDKIEQDDSVIHVIHTDDKDMKEYEYLLLCKEKDRM